MSEEYGGVLGAVPYAFRRSDSRLFRAYVLLGGGLAGLLVVFFAFALVVVVGRTLGTAGGTFTFVRSVFVLFGLVVVAPLLAPILLVARRHRRVGSDPTYDAALAVAGAGYALTLYLGAVASMPSTFELDGEVRTRPEPAGVTAPLVAALYALPEELSWLLPLGGAALVYVAHRRYR